MPLYEYQCDSCGHRFELIRKFTDPPPEACPKCGGRVTKLFSSPAIQFKGSGFYITDYARKGESSGSGKSEAGDSAKSKDSGDSSSKDSAAKESSAKDSGSKDSGSKESSSKDSSSKDSGSKDSASKDAPAKAKTEKSGS
jgi:putative FmdB family regulatory protein